MSGDKRTQRLLLAVLTCAVSCGTPAHRRAAAPTPDEPIAPLSRAADAAMIEVPSGMYAFGSTPEERERAYEDALRTNGDDRARRGRWFEREEPRHQGSLVHSALLDRAPVTQAQYAEYIAENWHLPVLMPSINARAWRSQGFRQDYATEVARFNWRIAGGLVRRDPALGRREDDGPWAILPPAGRDDHPVVLIRHDEAVDYCRWRGRLVGQERWLPSQELFEAAARGADGRIYPWGDEWDPSKLNTADGGPNDTMPVGSFPPGPLGHVDLAGNVFHWTSSKWKRGGKEEWIVKGSAWDDRGGVGRGASRHGRPDGIRHVIVGFRCAGVNTVEAER